MKISLYFDPSCPFCWITSRWLERVRAQRDLVITYQPFSLALKNDELDGQSESPYAASHLAAHRVLRVMQAAAATGAAMDVLYTAFGRRKHIDGQDYDDQVIGQVLAELELPAALLQAADDRGHDEALQQSIERAVAIAGQDIGTPTIIFETAAGPIGYYGPVLQRLPNEATGLKLWDGLSTLASNPDFYELKRGRPEGGPDTASTAVCFP